MLLFCCASWDCNCFFAQYFSLQPIYTYPLLTLMYTQITDNFGSRCWGGGICWMFGSFCFLLLWEIFWHWTICKKKIKTKITLVATTIYFPKFWISFDVTFFHSFHWCPSVPVPHLTIKNCRFSHFTKCRVPHSNSITSLVKTITIHSFKYLTFFSIN